MILFKTRSWTYVLYQLISFRKKPGIIMCEDNKLTKSYEINNLISEHNFVKQTLPPTLSKSNRKMKSPYVDLVYF